MLPPNYGIRRISKSLERADNRSSMLHLDYISCLLTIVSTIMVGRKLWAGWVIASVNSVIICVIALRTSQFGFIPANIFCILLYVWNSRQWRNA